ncbi:MAG: CaiB/BaiF CoA transferase family protein, partial [Acidimicrobiales bacterium]
RRPAAAPAPPRAEAQSGGPDRALTGLKVLDFMWAVAGPSFTRALADHGATVVKLESQSRTDGARTVGPFLGDDPGPENTALWHNMGAGKLGLALDLRKPEAHAVVLDLVRWADVVTESFSPRAMRAMGLGYETLAEVNPGLIMVSSCLMGQSGPMAQYAGFGTMAAAICGFHHLTGWPDRPPVGPFSAYTDYVAPRFTLAAFLSALDERERTGMGQHLDFSQLEASLHLLGPALLDWTVNGREAQRAGNDDPRFAPHGVYRCAGPDAWAAIACETDEQHRALCAVIGAAGLAGLAAAERVARRRELDAVIEAWTAARPAAEVEAALVAAGVPAHRVQDSALCVEDPQLVHRGHFVRVPHPLHGETWVENSRLHLHRTPARVERPGPTFGQDAWEILSELLGYDDERIAELAAAEALE